VHCFYVCSNTAQLGYLLWVSRSVACDLSVLGFSQVWYHSLLGLSHFVEYYNVFSVCCFRLFVSTCQVIG